MLDEIAVLDPEQRGAAGHDGRAAHPQPAVLRRYRGLRIGQRRRQAQPPQQRIQQLTRDTRDSDDLHITGEISTAAGWVEILSRRYQLERAQISLSGQVPPNPLLDVQIARKLDDATIYIQVTGSARKPVINFTTARRS
jgi:hypothetical protein